MKRGSRFAFLFWPLRIGLGATAFLAGADKFTNLLADWEKYIAPEAAQKLPMSDKSFMRIVGVIEMLVGIGILSPKVEISSYAASAWLTCIATNLVLDKDYDVAVRDINMAIGAFVLGQLSGIRTRQSSEQQDLAPHKWQAA